MRPRKQYTPEELLEKYEKHLAMHREYNRQYRIDHPDKVEKYRNETAKKYYQANKERLNKMRTDYNRRKREQEKLMKEQQTTIIFV